MFSDQESDLLARRDACGYDHEPNQTDEQRVVTRRALALLSLATCRPVATGPERHTPPTHQRRSRTVCSLISLNAARVTRTNCAT
jgi:hypothetical protein